MTCQTCKQLTKKKELIDGAYCSVVCKALVIGEASIYSGDYWSFNK